MWNKRLPRVLLATTAIIVLVGGGVLFTFTRPHYAWLTFGPQERVRVLLCDRGLWFSITQFVDGKRNSVERVDSWDILNGLTLRDPDGQTTYTISSATYVSRETPSTLMAHVDIDGPLSYSQYCDVGFSASDSRSAHVAHFHGPLTVGVVTVEWKQPKSLALLRGESPTSLRSVVGTMDAARGCWVVVSSHDDENKPRFEEGIRPEVEIVFPAQSEGAPPIVEQYALDQVCCGAVFYAPVPVPESAGDGVARVTFSFPSWNEAHVAPSTIELPIVPAPTDAAPNVAAAASR